MKRQAAAFASLCLMLCSIFPVCAVTSWDTVTIILEENPSTGYEWQYTAYGDGFLNEVSSHYEQDRHVPGVVGAGGKRTWVFECAVPGNVVLEYIYVRAWEEGAMPERVVMYAIRISEDLSAVIRGRAETAADYLSVELAENPTTGYVWISSLSPEGFLVPASDAYIPDEAAENIVGAGGRHVWEYFADAQGEAELRFTLERSWETSAIDEFALDIAVDGDLNIQLRALE